MKKRSPDFYHLFVGGKEKNVKIFSRSLVKGVDLNFAGKMTEVDSENNRGIQQQSAPVKKWNP